MHKLWLQSLVAEKNKFEKDIINSKKIMRENFQIIHP
jgi:hypothetical protein